MNARDRDAAYLSGLRDGYVRGVLGIPLTVDDANLTREQLEAKYRAQWAEGGS